jgi:brefeldin A-resistance guanine nucleotide exchange factor 1
MDIAGTTHLAGTACTSIPPRMRYRSHPVSVSVDPISLIISECIAITSEIRKRAPSSSSSVSAILGGNPNPIRLGPPDISSLQHSDGALSEDVATETLQFNRWGLRGNSGKAIRDNPLMANFGKLRHELAGVKGMCRSSS